MKFCLKILENCNFLKGTHLAFLIKFIEATVHTLLAPQSGALRRSAYRDFHPYPWAACSFVNLMMDFSLGAEGRWAAPRFLLFRNSWSVDRASWSGRRKLENVSTQITSSPSFPVGGKKVIHHSGQICQLQILQRLRYYNINNWKVLCNMLQLATLSVPFLATWKRALLTILLLPH